MRSRHVRSRNDRRRTCLASCFRGVVADGRAVASRCQEGPTMRKPCRTTMVVKLIAMLLLGSLAHPTLARAQPTAKDITRCRRTIMQQFVRFVKAGTQVQ